jgi:hypothetical protein
MEESQAMRDILPVIRSPRMANVTFALYRGWRDDGHAQNSAMVVPTVTVTSGLARVTPTPTALSSLMRGVRL